MSWAQYVQALTGTNQFEFASIHGLDGGAWAASDAKQTPAPGEAKAIAGAKASFPSMAGTGITVCGLKYMYLRTGEEGGVPFVIGRKNGAQIIAYVTKQAVIIGVVKKTGAPGAANDAMAKLAKALFTAGY